MSMFDPPKAPVKVGDIVRPMSGIPYVVKSIDIGESSIAVQVQAVVDEVRPVPSRAPRKLTYTEKHRRLFVSGGKLLDSKWQTYVKD